MPDLAPLSGSRPTPYYHGNKFARNYGKTFKGMGNLTGRAPRRGFLSPNAGTPFGAREARAFGGQEPRGRYRFRQNRARNMRVH